MALAWENNPAGICEDAPCCGCCGPQGDGAFDPFEPPDYDVEGESYDLCEHGREEGDCAVCDGGMDEDDEGVFDEPSPDPYWMND